MQADESRSELTGPENFCFSKNDIDNWHKEMDTSLSNSPISPSPLSSCRAGFDQSHQDDVQNRLLDLQTHSEDLLKSLDLDPSEDDSKAPNRRSFKKSSSNSDLLSTKINPLVDRPAPELPDRPGALERSQTTSAFQNQRKRGYTTNGADYFGSPSLARSSLGNNKNLPRASFDNSMSLPSSPKIPENHAPLESTASLPMIRLKKKSRKFSLPHLLYNHSSPLIEVPGEKLSSVRLRGFADYYTKMSSNMSDLKASDQDRDRDKEHNNIFFQLWERLLDEEYSHVTLAPGPSTLLNRYKDAIPYEETRVKLNVYPDSELTDYINASYVQGYSNEKQYISSQAPMPHTIVDFWRMVWHENVSLIVMLTELKEGGKQKCHKYWPDDGEKDLVLVYIRVKHLSTNENTFAFTRMFDLYNEREPPEDQPKRVTQIQYKGWPDYGVPDSPDVYLDFHKYIYSLAVEDSKDPILVHCSAGIGRTGVFCTIDYAIERARKESLINIYDAVYKLRSCRRGMVQTIEQFMFCYRSLVAFIALEDSLLRKKNHTTFKKKRSKKLDG